MASGHMSKEHPFVSGPNYPKLAGYVFLVPQEVGAGGQFFVFLSK